MKTHQLALYKKMKRSFVFLGAALLAGQGLNAQKTIVPLECGGAETFEMPKALSCPANSPVYASKYNKQSFYVPTANDPVVTIKYAIHVFNKNDGSGSFPNTPQGINDLTQITGLVNYYSRYSTTRNANYVVSGFVSPYNNDSKVQYELTNIYFYNNTTLNTTENHDLMINAIYAADPARLKEGMPVLISNALIVGGAAAGHYLTANSPDPQNPGTIPLVHTVMLTPGHGLWWCHEHLLHEIGHAVGWGHTYNSETLDPNIPDFLSDVFPQNNPNCAGYPGNSICYEVCQTMGSNNVMSGCNLGASWMSPLQQGRRLRNLHLPANNLRKYVKEMTSSVAGAWNITASETWDFDIQMYQDIIVKPGATLTVKCRIGMAQLGRIVVERGAKLVIDGGEVYAWGRSWDGIHVWGTSNKRQLISGGMAVDHGIVSIINDGTVRDASTAITTIKTDASGNWDWGYTGGIIQCDAAKFINNWRAIQYLSYHNTNSTGTMIIPNVGYIRRSLFETNAVLKTGGYANVFVTNLSTEGVKFYGNTYQNTMNPQPSWDNIGDGFYTIDASYLIDDYSSSPSTFKNLQYGVQIQNGVALSNIAISNNDFINCNRSVYMNNTLNTKITNNTIDVGNGLNNVAYLPYGIYSENSSAYDISNNTIFSTQWTNYNLSLGTGICVNGTNGLNNLIYRNSINMMGAGVTVYGNNQGTNPGDGLKLRCNNFGQGTSGLNYMDMYMANSNSMNGRIDKMQGSTSLGANNAFSHTNNSNLAVRTDYSDNPNLNPGLPGSIQYYYNATAPQLKPLYYNNSMAPFLVNTTFNYETMCPASLTSSVIIGGGLNQRTVSTDEQPLNTLLTSFMANEERGLDQDAIIRLMKADNRVEAKLRLMDAYMAFGKYQEASTLSNEIRNQNKGSLEQYYQFQQKMLTLKSSSQNPYGFKVDAASGEILASPASIRDWIDYGHEEVIDVPNASIIADHGTFTDLVSQQKAGDASRLFPNPSDDKVTIYFSKNAAASTSEITVSDITGKEILKMKTESNASGQLLETQGLAPGVYSISLLQDGKVMETLKFIKQ